MSNLQKFEIEASIRSEKPFVFFIEYNAKRAPMELGDMIGNMAKAVANTMGFSVKVAAPGQLSYWVSPDSSEE